MQSVESLLYVDTDILFLSPVGDIWKFFKRFNDTQIAALTPEHEDPNIGWYNRFARHPYYGPLGVNSGVMLMNLTRMRLFKWEEHVLPIHKEYKLRITWGDQDIINILFYYHPGTYFFYFINMARKLMHFFSSFIYMRHSMSHSEILFFISSIFLYIFFDTIKALSTEHCLMSR